MEAPILGTDKGVAGVEFLVMVVAKEIDGLNDA